MESLVTAPPVVTVVWAAEDSSPRRLIIRSIIQTIRLDPSRSAWIDEAPNLSRPDPSGTDQTDVEHQATDLAVGGSNPSRRAASPQGCSSTSCGRSARARVWETASTAWTTAATTSRATWVGPPPAKQDRNRRRWLSSNGVTGDGLASRPGRTRRPPPNRHRDYCGRCRPWKRTPTSWSAGSASKRAPRRGRALLPHPGQLLLPYYLAWAALQLPGVEVEEVPM
jgi:hypothetical protein